MKNRKKIKPIYYELQGYLTEAPKVNAFYDKELWERFNSIVQELNEINRDKNYDCFLIDARCVNGNEPWVEALVYRSKISGLISRLYAEYFSDEPAPFGEVPNTIIQQNQQQNQSFNVQMLLEIQSKIDEKMPDFDEKSKEKTFLQKVKSSLKTVSSLPQLITLLLSTGKDMGLTLAQTLNIFK